MGERLKNPVSTREAEKVEGGVDEYKAAVSQAVAIDVIAPEPIWGNIDELTGVKEDGYWGP